MPANLYFAFAVVLPVVLLPFVRPRFLLLIVPVAVEYMLARGGADGVAGLDHQQRLITMHDIERRKRPVYLRGKLFGPQLHVLSFLFLRLRNQVLKQ